MKETWNKRYGETEYFYGESPNTFLEKISAIIPPGSKVLCIAEGEGRNAVFLRKLGHDVTAVDFSEEARTKALTLAKKHGVDLEYLISPLESFDFGQGKWDAVVSIFAHLSPAIREEVYQKIVASLKVDGQFIIEAYTPEQLNYGTGGPKDITMLCTPEILKNELSPLEWPVLKEELVELSEGVGHQGMSAVIHGYGVKVLN